MARGTGAQLTEEQLAAGANRFQITEREEGSGIFNTLRHAIINLPASVAQEVGYVAEMIQHPLDTGEALLRVAAGYAQKALPDSWEQYLPEDWATNKMYAEAINQHYIDRYGSLEGALDAIAEEPVSVALDVFIVGGVLKATAKQAAKVSTALNKAATTAKGTVLEGELAQRAANATAVSTEVKAAAEASRVAEAEAVILVYDKASGVYVPTSSVGEVAAATKSGGTVVVGGEVINIPKGTFDARGAALNEVAWITGESGLYGARTVDGKMLLPEQVAQIMNQNIVAHIDDVSKYNKNLPQNPIEAAKIAEGYQGKISKVSEGIVVGELAGKTVNLKRVSPDDWTRAAIADGMPHYMGVRNNKDGTLDVTGAAIVAGTERVAAVGRTYPIRNQAQIAAHEKRMESLQRYMDEQGMISGSYAERATTRLDDAVKAETAALSAEAGEAYSLARRTVGDMYPTGMVTKAAELAKTPTYTGHIPNWVKGTGVKAAETAAKVDVPYQAIARTVKASEMADQFTNPDIPAIDIPMAPDKGPVLEAGFEYKPHLRPEEKETQTMEVPEVTRPGWKLPHQFDREPMVEGNYWSVDFEDEHWNTPAGINEAMGLYGRPIGSRYTGQYQATSNPFVNRKFNPLTGQYN